MFRNELKNEFLEINKNINNINDEIIKIKVAIHNMEKLGYNTKDFEKLLDNIGIEYKKFKNRVSEEWKICK